MPWFRSGWGTCSNESKYKTGFQLFSFPRPMQWEAIKCMAWVLEGMEISWASYMVNNYSKEKIRQSFIRCEIFSIRDIVRRWIYIFESLPTRNSLRNDLVLTCTVVAAGWPGTKITTPSASITLILYLTLVAKFKDMRICRWVNTIRSLHSCLRKHFHLFNDHLQICHSWTSDIINQSEATINGDSYQPIYAKWF